MTPAEHLWHCFGCDAGGDVIRFVELMDKVSFPEAVKRLNGHQRDAFVPATDQTPSSPGSPSGAGSTADRPTVRPTQCTKLLTRVATFYQKCFANRPDGMKYLIKGRGITNVTHFKNYQIGYADGSLLEALPQDDDSLNLFSLLFSLLRKIRGRFPVRVMPQARDTKQFQPHGKSESRTLFW